MVNEPKQHCSLYDALAIVQEESPSLELVALPPDTLRQLPATSALRTTTFSTVASTNASRILSIRYGLPLDDDALRIAPPKPLRRSSPDTYNAIRSSRTLEAATAFSLSITVSFSSAGSKNSLPRPDLHRPDHLPYPGFRTHRRIRIVVTDSGCEFLDPTSLARASQVKVFYTRAYAIL